ncbi:MULTISPECIES: SpoIIIAH-like family protein [Lysinibacillus]|uniref:SpoIIIAH-like family protein n=1 Tax=Lysinibacillus antri TaxID=2498145 RepID=A0A432LG81_9BACI|nr:MULTISPECIES: SpoIIIAH-like family protein [Lysinibacillus]RUL56936.1 SpoIIIAH-like family protein [Lysinibacillus antri]TSI08575.1 SpoIIIAH-like family protein [Lysinibacillus sp. BW-2-10]
MKVKRRTVWLLTLLSLAAVISVYYVFEPNRDVDLLTIFTDDTLKETTLTGVNEEEILKTTSESYLFDEMRMEISNERSQIRDQLTQKIASDQYSAEEKNEAYNEMNALIEQESSESMLEMLIESLGYSDALVRVEGEKALVTVLTDELSKQQANEIIYIVRSELEEVSDVTVNPQSNYY